MKKQLFALLGLGMVLASASAYAQSIKLKADVPFNFVITGRTVPRGEYNIRAESDTHLLSISAAGQKPSLFLANPCLSLKGMEASQQTKLVFDRYGDQYFLSEIWMKGNRVGHQLQKSRREVEIAQNKTAEQVIVLAQLR